MELELVSIKESSQGCRGNGRQDWWYCLIIQIGYDYHSARVPQSWSRARWPLWSQTGVCSGASDGALACSDEMKLISCFNFHKRDSKRHLIYCGLKHSVIEPIFCLLGFLLPGCDCSILSSLRACRRCSSMKTGSLQCCNLMAHAASKQHTFYWPCYSLVYPTELPGQVEAEKDFPLFLTKCICSVLLSDLSVMLSSI